MLIEPQDLDLMELSARAGVSPRTIRYYIQQGLLPGPEARGPGAHYTAEHVDRLRLIRRLQREHLPLAEIRRRIAGLDPSQMRSLLEQPRAAPSSASEYIRRVMTGSPPLSPALHEPRVPVQSPLRPTDSLLSPRTSEARSQWERLAFTDDVELHIRRPLTREQNRQVERLIDAARRIFKEEP